MDPPAPIVFAESSLINNPLTLVLKIVLEPSVVELAPKRLLLMNAGSIGILIWGGTVTKVSGAPVMIL
jgi:hypothetical protein